MATSPSNSGDNLDPRKIRRLAELMNECDLGEIDLRDGSLRIRLRKRGEQPARVAPAASAPAASTAPVAAEARAAVPAAASADDQLATIKSIMVGTFFTAPNPDSAPFVKVGDRVGVDTTVCIIEAMKVFNEIQAGVSGKIAAVLVKNGEPVEYGQPLFKVDVRS